MHVKSKDRSGNAKQVRDARKARRAGMPNPEAPSSPLRGFRKGRHPLQRREPSLRDVPTGEEDE